jgi:RNA polymerase sigma-70 factor (ECF subfamily)
MIADRPSEQFVQQLTGCQPRLYAYIAVLAGDAEVAGDILQETNLVMWRKADEFVEGTDFATWSSAIARFQVLAWFRDQSRDRHRFDEVLLADLATSAANAVQHFDDRRQALRACLEKLIPGHRDLLRVRYFEGKSVAETAQLTGRTAKGVITTMGRIRQMLFECIERRLAREGRS